MLRIALILYICTLVNVDLTFAQEYVPGEVIVKFKSGSDGQQVLSKSGLSQKLTRKGGWKAMHLNHYSFKSGQSVESIVQQLQQDPEVEYAEPNYLFKKAELNEKTEVLTKAEVALQFSGGNLSLTSANIQTTEAWSALSSSGNTPIVAVIDSGIDLTHEALADAIWINEGEVASNGVDDDGNGYVDDVTGWNFVENNNDPTDGDGHGTHVAGIVRGVSQDLFQSPMQTPTLRIMPLRFLDDHGVGSTSDAIRAIYYAVNNGARILNNSWGGPTYSRALHEAIVYSYQARTLFVAAAGNAKSNNDQVAMYPANYDVPNVLSIAATNDFDSIASFSNYGTQTVHLAGPGVSILSSYPVNLYTYLSGTSMASPFVAGVAALMAHEQPTMTGYQIKSLLMSSADRIGSLSTRVSSSGRVNAFKAVTAAQNAAVQADQPPYYMQASSQDRALASNLAMGGGGCGSVAKLYKDLRHPQDGASRGWTHLFLLAVLAIPLVVILRLKKSTPSVRRRFQRYHLHSTVKFNVGDAEVDGLVGTISMGGMGINSPVQLAEGSTVRMTVTGPDGRETIHVEGKVVWSTSEKKYGISFSGLEKEVQDTITRWSRKLVRSY